MEIRDSKDAITTACTEVQVTGGGRLYAWSRIRDGQVRRHGLRLGKDAAQRMERCHPAAQRFIKGKRDMGFLFYANFVRFVLRGEFAIVLVEHARAFVRAAGR